MSLLYLVNRCDINLKTCRTITLFVVVLLNYSNLQFEGSYDYKPLTNSPNNCVC